jgi:competence protein ComEC
VRGVGGLELADGKPQSFALNVWRDTYADPISAAAVQSCDALACIGRSAAGFSYAIVRNAAAFAEECGRADLIIARVPAPAWCASGVVIDPAALERHGVHWLRWQNGRFEVRPAVADLERPWRIKP